MSDRLFLCGSVKVAAGTAGRCGWSPSALISGQVFRLKAITIYPNAALSADNTNYATIRAYNGASAASSARSTTVAGGALSLGTPEDLTLTAGQGDFTRASPLSVQVAHSGTGGAVDISVQVEYEVVR